MGPGYGYFFLISDGVVWGLIIFIEWWQREREREREIVLERDLVDLIF